MSLYLSFKICIVGEPGVGKTSLIIRYIENKFQENYIPTIGVDFLSKKIKVGKDKVPVNLVIWDIGGDDKWKKRINLYLKGSDGVVCVYDITRKNTFSQLDFWINQIREYRGDIPYIIIGNKKDLEALRNISFEEASSYINKKDNVPVLESSAKTGETVNEMFYKLAENIIIQKAKKKV